MQYPGLDFDKQSHTYTWHNRVIPSVTQVIGYVSHEWYGNECATEAKRRIGVAVHAAVDLDNQGKLDRDSLHPDIKGYFEAWLTFKETALWQCEHSEARLFDRHALYAGTCDCIGALDAQPALIDIKTSATLSRWVGVQTIAYHRLAVKEGLCPYNTRRYALQLKPDGGFKLKEYREDDYDHQLFSAALVLAHDAIRHKGVNWRCDL